MNLSLCGGDETVMTGQAVHPGLLFRRQFILGPGELEGFPSWQRLRIGTRRLAVHPDLPVHQVAGERASLTLLGYALDPGDPAADDRQILTRWLGRIEAAEDILALSGEVSGRFVLILHTAEVDWLLHDAAGLRTAVYTTGSAAEFWCASSTALLAHQLGLVMAPELRAEWMDGYPRQTLWIPGDATLYSECRALLANHCLDLRAGVPFRFWPKSELPRRSMEDVAPAAAQCLRGILSAGRHRFPLAIGVTAGLDTRLLLAAARDIRGEVFFLTHCQELGPDHPDVMVAADVFRRLGLSHTILPEELSLRAELYAMCARSLSAPAERRCRLAQALFEGLPPGHVWTNGHIGEMCRCVYSRRHEPTATWLARRSFREGSVAAVRALQRWLDEATPAAGRCGFPLLDLYYWEGRMARWVPEIQAHLDLVVESFTPFNCRALQELLLSVDEKDRDKRRGSALSIRIIRELWPELPDSPINPHRKDRYAGMAEALALYPSASNRVGG